LLVGHPNDGAKAGENQKAEDDQNRAATGGFLLLFVSGIERIDVIFFVAWLVSTAVWVGHTLLLLRPRS
jgi:hypothetical protein